MKLFRQLCNRWTNRLLQEQFVTENYHEIFISEQLFIEILLYTLGGLGLDFEQGF